MYQPFGLTVLLNAVTGSVVRIFLCHDLPLVLKNLHLHQHQHVLFVHGGAPSCFVHIVRRHLKLTLDGLWIGRGGPVS